jgi:D-glycero-D-manno-heptose 1,7-bisphosphate phosphatase
MRTVFLDRDGTLNTERGFVTRVEDFSLLPGAIEAVQLLHDAGFALVVVTNQSGIARGLYRETTLARIHAHAHELLGGRIRAWLHCPHHPDEAGAYGRRCDCRKPNSGLLHQAAELVGSTFEGSYLVGDAARDVLMAGLLPLTTLMVRSGKDHPHELHAARTGGRTPDACVDDVLAAARWILAREAALTHAPSAR